MRTAIAIAFGALLAGCASNARRPESGAAAVRPESARPAVDDELSPERAELAQRFRDIVLTDQTGKRVRLFEDLVKGRVVVLNFMFVTCTGSCPRNTGNLVEVQRLLNGGVQFVSISLDAENDTPEVLAEYARAHGVGPGWSFLTGDKDEIDALRKSLGFYDPDPVVDADRTQHAGTVLYGNERIGRWSHMPALLSPEFIAAGVRRVML